MANFLPIPACGGASTVTCWQTCLLRPWCLLALFSVARASEFSVPGEQEPLNVATASPPTAFQWDPKGYVVFCLCMGRFGNQAAHFLGALNFAKEVDRTFVVPPFITYVRDEKPIPYKEWFDVEPLREYHRVITMEDFMEHLAPLHWPPGNRTAYCYKPYPPDSKDCAMKYGNPFGPFWDHYGVDFDSHVFHNLGYEVHIDILLNAWKERYPPSSHPVVALKGAPAQFPMAKHNRHLQRYMRWSQHIISMATMHMDQTIKGRHFMGIHLRIGSDWSNACKNAAGSRSYMESLQCMEALPPESRLTSEMCFPSTAQMVAETKKLMAENILSVLFIAADKQPNLQEFKKGLGSNVDVYWVNPERPQVDLYILEQADVFIGNCPSSFTAFVKRARDLSKRPTFFWGLIKV